VICNLAGVVQVGVVEEGVVQLKCKSKAEFNLCTIKLKVFLYQKLQLYPKFRKSTVKWAESNTHTQPF
jgi:hypothetical protein